MKLLPDPESLDEEDDNKEDEDGIWVRLGSHVMKKTREQLKVLDSRNASYTVIPAPKKPKGGHSERIRATGSQKRAQVDRDGASTSIQHQAAHSAARQSGVDLSGQGITRSRKAESRERATPQIAHPSTSRTTARVTAGQTSRASLRSKKTGREFTPEERSRGGKKGGKARWKGMTPEMRAAAARKAVMARWAKSRKK
jgi:hypothetical protein